MNSARPTQDWPQRFRPTAKLTVDLAGGPGAAGAARRALTGLERHLRGRMLDDLRLLVSELVTNSVRHCDADPAADLKLHAVVSTESVRVEVMDSCAGFDPPNGAQPEDGAAGGWGLYLVEMLSDRWGVDRSHGTRVWFEIDRHATAQRTA